MLLLKPSAFSAKKYEIIIANVKLLPEITSAIDSAGVLGYTVSAGVQLGTPTARSGCEDFVRIGMRLRANASEYVDAKPYLMKPLLSFPKWVTEADQWYIKLLFITIRQVPGLCLFVTCF